MIPLVIGISIISFITMYAAGDPITIITMGKPTITEAQRQAIRVYYGLDKPVPVQYINWLVNLLRGDFGTSFTYGGRPVSELIAQWFWPTVELQIISLALSVALSIPIGIMSAKNQYSKRDLAVTSVALFGVSMPTFWLGVILIIVFSYTLSWLPSAHPISGPCSE
jgi:peptide/nickel transport system permease protein